MAAVRAVAAAMGKAGEEGDATVATHAGSPVFTLSTHCAWCCCGWRWSSRRTRLKSVP